MLFDLPIAELRTYRPELSEPADFGEFWAQTLTETATHDLDVQFTPYDAGLANVDAYDVRFSGYAGHRIAGWLLTTRGQSGPRPTVVQYLGYGSGRGLAHEWLLWPSAGYSVLVMDTRGQGSGPTGDPDIGYGPHYPGMMSRGILSPQAYYYRRVFADAVRAVDAAKAHPLTDGTRVIVSGASQGGGIAQAVAGLRTDIFAALIDVPFLTHFERATELTDEAPYSEIAEYLKVNRHDAEAAFRTLRYFDGVHFAARATAPARYSVSLMDLICPPSTVFAAYNRYSGPAEIDVWKFNGHEGGGSHQISNQLRWVRQLITG